MITLKSIEINPIENTKEKQILLNWDIGNGVESYNLVSIKEPFSVNNVTKALRDLYDIVKNDINLIDEETKKERWKREYKEVLQIKYYFKEEYAEQIYLENMQKHTYSEIPENAVDEDMRNLNKQELILRMIKKKKDISHY